MNEMEKIEISETTTDGTTRNITTIDNPEVYSLDPVPECEGNSGVTDTILKVAGVAAGIYFGGKLLKTGAKWLLKKSGYTIVKDYDYDDDIDENETEVVDEVQEFVDNRKKEKEK